MTTLAFLSEMYQKAATYLSSRAFPSTLLSSNPSLVVTPSSYPVLLPGVDMFNHKRAQPVSWTISHSDSSPPKPHADYVKDDPRYLRRGPKIDRADAAQANWPLFVYPKPEHKKGGGSRTEIEKLLINLSRMVQFEFADTTALTCLLCARQFKTLDQLKRHNKESDPHKVGDGQSNIGHAALTVRILRKITRTPISATLPVRR